MLKKILLTISLVCVVGILVLFFIFLKRHHTRNDFEMINAVPINTVCIVQVNNTSQFVHKTASTNPIWQNLRNIPLIDKITRNAFFIDSLVANTPKISHFFNKRPSIISVHFTRNKDYDFLFATHVDNEDNAESIVNLVTSLASRSGRVTSYSYDKTKVYHVQLDIADDNTVFYFAIINNTFIASKVKVLVQSSIGQIHAGESLLNNKNFALVHNSADIDKDANLYVNYKELGNFTGLYASPLYAKAVSQANNLASWEELDLSVKDKMLFMSGIITTDSLLNNYFDVYAAQEPVSMEIQSVIPSSASSFIAVAISNPVQYKNSLDSYRKAKGIYSNYRKNLNDIDTACNASVEDLFYDIVEGEMCAVISGEASADSGNHSYAIFQTKSRSLTEGRMLDLLASYSAKKNIPVDSFLTQISLDKGLTHTFYKMPASNIPKAIFGDMFAYTSGQFFVVLDNYLVMGNTVASLSLFVKDIVLNKTLSNNTKFKNMDSYMTDNYNLFFYSNIPTSLNFCKEMVRDAYSKHFDSYYAAYKNLQGAAFHLTQNNGHLFNTVCITHDPKNDSKAQTVWESHLDSLPGTKPTLVLNSQTNEKEILVQDKRNTIYLLSNSGRILWKQKIGEPINSEIFQIDFYKNGKKQFAFSTSNHIYIVDRIGNFVEQYPIQLKSPSSAGVAVFDYDNNRNYRMAIPCSDRRIYVYTIDGKLLKDWSFPKTEEPITAPLKHYRVKTNDYVVCTDKYNVYLLNRRGEQRIALKEKFELSKNSQVLINTLLDDDASQFIVSDKDGRIKLIDFDGQVTTLDLGKYSSNHLLDARDINNDGINELVICEGEEVSVYGLNSKKLFTFECDGNITHPPSFFVFSPTDTKIGVLCADEKTIYLINNNGSLYSGFPLTGTTPFSIGYFNKQSQNFNLVVGGDENFIYNYEIK